MFRVRSLDEEQNWPYLCLIFYASWVLYWICNKKRITPWGCVSAEEFNHTIRVLVKDTLSSLSEATCRREGPPVCSQMCEITLGDHKAGPCLQDSEETREYSDCLSS